MTIEVVGSRVIGPLFGVSLFVWTSLIGVTLVALSLGYAAGGLLADRPRAADVLYGLILLAGLATLAVPALKAVVLRACVPLGLRAGALVGSLLLFGPGLFLLGTVSPFLVRIAAGERRRIGATVGLVTALSTLGSLAGTLLTGFFLIARFGTNRIFQAGGGLLLALSLLYFVVLRKRALATLVLLAPLAVLPAEPPRSKVMSNGTRVTEVYRKESFYGRVQVVDYSYGPIHNRELLIDGVVQGGMDLSSGLSVYEHTYFLEHLPFGMKPDGQSCLVVGVGPGLVPRWYEARGIRTDVVDIDPEVVRAAQEYFAFRVTGETVLADARVFLAGSRKRYDYVIVDVFNGDTTPSHLLSVEALRLLRARLADGGMLAMNMAGRLGQGGFMTASVVRTFEQVFRTVEIYPAFSAQTGEGFGNLIVLAHQGEPRPFDPRAVRGLPVHPLAADIVGRFLGQRYRFGPEVPALVLSDEFNPIDVRDAWLKERVRREILRSTDWDILI